MQVQKTKYLPASYQFIISISAVLLSALVCFFFNDWVAYRTVSLILLLVVSVLAMLFDIWPVLVAATLSALIWDYFFIPPTFTLHVAGADDALMLLMYFVIALVNAALTFNIRKIDIDAIVQSEKAHTLSLYNTLLNSLSHELRTPIATIIVAGDNLQTNTEKLSEEQSASLLTEIQTAALRLNGQVENLLNMSRLESGVIEAKKDWCDLNELVYTVINRLGDNAKSHDIQVLIWEDLPLFKLDYGLMEQVIHNLVNNALHYTPAGSHIVIQATAENDTCEIIISDNGSGFPHDEIDRVFEKFYRLKNTKTGGTGLGLSIVRGVVEAHGGTIHLRNGENGGAFFTIVIPTEISYVNQLDNE